MSDDKEIASRIRKALAGNSAWFMYPGKWDGDTDDYLPRSIALDGRFTLHELELIVSILKEVKS